MRDREVEEPTAPARFSIRIFVSKTLLQKTGSEIHVRAVGLYGVGFEMGKLYDVDVAHGILDVTQSWELQEE